MKSFKRQKQIIILALIALLIPVTGCSAIASSKPRLFKSLPEYCNTPDGMTLDPKTGNIILACPNFNNHVYPGVLMKITPSNELSLYYPMPAHPDTKIAGPMGMDIGPDGNVYVADNQYFYDKDHKSRLIRIVVENGIPVRAEVAVDGFKLSNAVIWRGNYVYVSDTFMDLPGDPSMSGVYRISLEDMQKGKVTLMPLGSDPRLISKFKTMKNSRNETAGADGLTFDSKGNLYVSSFGDGSVYKISFDEQGRASTKLFFRDPAMPCGDGMFCDLSTDEIYVADSQCNAIRIISPDGKMRTLWQNDDTDGSDGGLDQPAEVIIRGNELIVANFDMPFPGLKNSKFDAPYTLSVIKLKK